METYQALDMEKIEYRPCLVRDAICLAEPLIETEAAEERVFSMLIETANYRVEIEIGYD